MVTGNDTRSTKSALPARPASAPGAKFAEALGLLPRFLEGFADLLSDEDHEGELIEVSALAAGLDPILRGGALSTADADHRELAAHQVRLLLVRIDESIPADARDAPLFREVWRSLEKIRRLMIKQCDSSTLPPDDAANAAPAADTEAGEASATGDWRAQVAKVLAEVSQLADDAVKIAEEGSNCWRLLMIADIYYLQYETEFYDTGKLIDELCDLEALFAGAAGIDGAPRGLIILCDQAAEMVSEAARMVDNASIAAAHAKGARHG